MTKSKYHICLYYIGLLAFLPGLTEFSDAFRAGDFLQSSSPNRNLQSNCLRSVASTSTQLGLFDADASFVAGSALWGLNLYYGFDWILAPLGTGLDSDFNAATRATTFLGRILSGKSVTEAASPLQLLEDGEADAERPEMGSRIGSGANIAYITSTIESDDGTNDWLSDREAGLSSSAPLPLQLAVALLFGIAGIVAQTITHSFQTAAVLVIPALVYEIGRPSLPTRDEAIFDAKLDAAVTKFVQEKVVVYGQEGTQNEGVAPVRRDEATNERELVTAFRKQLQENKEESAGLESSDVSDFQIEMKMRSYGQGRSVGGFIKGIRLLRDE